jgi:predicted dithiol-disulfide oxidoreductase (DUF899 family)
MSVTFPHETPDYRGARTALLEREVALRREMEALAAELRALPAGGEVPEDYSFDSIGLDGALSTVRLSELFRGGDTLMLYHYMFPRHAQDSRPGPTAGAMALVPLAEGPCPSCTALIDMWEGTMPHFEASAATLPWSQRPRSSGSRRSRATRDGSTSGCCQLRTTPSSGTIMARTRRVSRSRS